MCQSGGTFVIRGTGPCGMAWWETLVMCEVIFVPHLLQKGSNIVRTTLPVLRKCCGQLGHMSPENKNRLDSHMLTVCYD